jgi:hypothetical protein
LCPQGSSPTLLSSCKPETEEDVAQAKNYLK